MQASSRQIAGAIFLALTACAGQSTSIVTGRPERVGSCVPEQPCELAGEFLLHHEPGNYNTATIDQAHTTCIPLLVPETLFKDYDRWQQKKVRIVGTALARAATAPDVSRIKYRDRWLLEGICGNSDIVVYVDKIERDR